MISMLLDERDLARTALRDRSPRLGIWRKGFVVCSVAGVAASSIAFAADVVAPSGKPNAAVQNTSVLAADILSRWAPIAEAAGLDMSLWQEQFTTQLRSMPMDGLIIL